MGMDEKAPDSSNPKPQYVFVLVHGTFAPNAPWVHQADSELRVTLQDAFQNEGVTFVPFVWRGFLGSCLNNTHRYRLKGSEKLRDELVKVRASNPGAKIFVISHSHGGNVVLYAMRDTRAAAAVDGIICMATPFFVVRSDGGVHSTAGGWLVFLQGLFWFGGSLLVPLAIFFLVIVVAVHVLPLFNHYLQLVIGPLFTIAGMMLGIGFNLLAMQLYPTIEDLVDGLVVQGQLKSEQRLRIILPTQNPVFCLLVSGDEFRSLFGISADAMGAIKHKYVTIAFFITGAALVAVCEWRIVHALRGIWADALKNGMMIDLATIAGGCLVSLMVLIPLVGIVLATLRTLADRLITRFRTVLYGWERFPEMLLSDIEATPLPYGHKNICFENLILDRLHIAKSYTMEGKTWPRHCEIYLNDEARNDIATWINAKSGSEVTECPACRALETQNKVEVNPSPRIDVPLVVDSGRSDFHLPGHNPTV
jgi:hypothetical protein